MKSATSGAETVSSFLQRPPWSYRSLWFVLSAVIVAADYCCGRALLFPIFFIFPVMLAAWNCARREAIAIFLTAAWFGLSLLRDPLAPMLPDVMNTLVRCVVLLVLAVLVSRLADQNAKLARQVKQLEGLIPICSHCKNILDEEKHWTRLESYIMARSQAEFTHGLCPDCARVHYGMKTTEQVVF